jgi:hypothetical protein
VFGASIYARKFTNEAKTKNTPLDLYIKPHVQKTRVQESKRQRRGVGVKNWGGASLKKERKNWKKQTNETDYMKQYRKFFKKTNKQTKKKRKKQRKKK